jgi:hypothetical protein
MIPTQTLHDFTLGLLSDPAASAAFQQDPEGALRDAGLHGMTPADVQDVLPLVLDHMPVNRVAGLGDAVHGLPVSVPGAGDLDASDPARLFAEPEERSLPGTDFPNDLPTTAATGLAHDLTGAFGAHELPHVLDAAPLDVPAGAPVPEVSHVTGALGDPGRALHADPFGVDAGLDHLGDALPGPAHDLNVDLDGVGDAVHPDGALGGVDGLNDVAPSSPSLDGAHLAPVSGIGSDAVALHQNPLSGHEPLGGDHPDVMHF